MARVLSTLLVAALAGALAAIAATHFAGSSSVPTKQASVALPDQNGPGSGNPCKLDPASCVENPPPAEPPKFLEPPQLSSDEQDDVYLVREAYVIPSHSDYSKTFINYVASCDAPDIALAPGWEQDFFRNAAGSPHFNWIEFMTPIAPNAVRYSIFPQKLDRAELVTLGLLCRDTVDWCPCFDGQAVAESGETSCVQAPGESGMRPAFESRPGRTFGVAQVVSSSSPTLEFRSEPRCEPECRHKTKGARYVCRSDAGERSITLRDYRACQRELRSGLNMTAASACLPVAAGEVHF